jgi:hypothetical protein
MDVELDSNKQRIRRELERTRWKSGRTHGNPIEHALVRQCVVLVDELESKSAGVAKSWRIWRGIKVGTDELLKMISDVVDPAHHLSDAGSTRLRYLECG